MKVVLESYILSSYKNRKRKNAVMIVSIMFATLLTLLPVVGITFMVISNGFSSLDWDFFTQLPKPVGEEGGGIANALVGTAILISIASAIGVPWGIGIGTFLSESNSKRANTIRICVDLLASIPSIVVGLFVYAVVVLPMKRFSALAGGIALGILMVPTIARSTEEILRLIPMSIRESGLALGLARWKVTVRILLRGSLPSLISGVMLAVARVSGETAPLLFTAFGNRFWHRGLDEPIASIPLQIFNYSISPYDDWHRQAWAAALILVLFVMVLNGITRILLKREI